MPFSPYENKEWILEKIKEVNPKSILDVGVGEGILEQIARPIFGSEVKIDGIEVWKPYISEYKLEDKYDNIFNVDAREWDIWDYDVVMFGDVLEHMTETEAVTLWNKAAKSAKSILLSIPIVHSPQGAWGGNPYEIHHEEDWNTDRVLNSFNGIIDYKDFTISGAYFARFDNEVISK